MDASCDRSGAVMRKKLSFTQRFPHFVNLPKNSKSPTDSIYKRYDILHQTLVLWSQDTGYVVRSGAPFTLRVDVNGKIRDIESKS